MQHILHNLFIGLYLFRSDNVNDESRNQMLLSHKQDERNRMMNHELTEEL